MQPVSPIPTTGMIDLPGLNPLRRHLDKGLIDKHMIQENHPAHIGGMTYLRPVSLADALFGQGALFGGSESNGGHLKMPYSSSVKLLVVYQT